MISKRLLIEIVAIFVLVIAIVAYFLLVPGANDIKSVEQPTAEQNLTPLVPLYPGLDWKEVEENDQTFSGFPTLEFCPYAPNDPSGCSTFNSKSIQLPSQIKVKEYTSHIKHDPPIRYGESVVFKDFPEFYDNKLHELGFNTNTFYGKTYLELPRFGGFLRVSLGYKNYGNLEKTIALYGRIEDEKIQFVRIQTDILDTSDCPEDPKDLFGKCNLNTEEIYEVIVSDEIPLLDISQVVSIPFSSPNLTDSIPLYPGLDWKEVTTDDQNYTSFSILKSCPYGEECYLNDRDTVYLPDSVKTKKYVAFIRHDPPIRGGESIAFNNFLEFYREKLPEFGLNTGTKLYLQEYGVTLGFWTGEKQNQIIENYARINDGKLKLVMIRRDSYDTSKCLGQPKNIFGGCNLDTEEIYEILISNEIPLSDIF
jgi:hypothetical protein|tara:strand:+ start:12301 stop:13569 length:1269 start_codon:yes stop_codon:yes gene_type:complete